MHGLRSADAKGPWAAFSRRLSALLHPGSSGLAANRPTPTLPACLAEAPVGSPLAFLRDGASIVAGHLRRLRSGLRARALFDLVARALSLQRRLETAWLSSGAATQLADAALEGESTPELATRIARIARELSGADAAGVYARSPEGLQLIGAAGECRAAAVAEEALTSGRTLRTDGAAALPLRVGDALVGVLALTLDGNHADLRALRPLLQRAGAVLASAEREARKDRFLSLAAHELKTPLTSIKGFSYSLARRLERGEPCDPRHVQVLERQAERLHSLLEEMLEVSRLETGRFHLHQEPCEVHELVDACVRALRRLGIEAGVESSAEPALQLVADRERVERALLAMVSRARAMGREVRIDGRKSSAHASIRVSWTGTSLSPQDREDAFSPRWEAPQAQRQGLGMALFIAREAALLHGGALHSEPQAFVLVLPLRGPSTEPVGRAVQGTVLVVDDDEPIARMMAEYLGEQGFEADWAQSGAEALAKVERKPPDLIVLDLRMPEMDGRTLLLRIRSLGKTPRVVLLSADREVAAVARELGTEAFVEKPFAPEGLLIEVRRALAPRPGPAK